jgi:hypothetical protein
MRSSSALFFILATLPALPAVARVPACTPVDDGVLRTSRDACISAHVYDVVTIPNGTRFLDLCSPETADAQCRFSIVSYSADKTSVGDLDQFRGKDVEIRGTVQLFGQRYLMVLNDERQFHRGQAHFRPDPRLLSGFSAEDSQAQDAPELRVNFHHHGKKLEHE